VDARDEYVARIVLFAEDVLSCVVRAIDFSKVDLSSIFTEQNCIGAISSRHNDIDAVKPYLYERALESCDRLKATSGMETKLDDELARRAQLAHDGLRDFMNS
jgi:hypothetical protein